MHDMAKKHPISNTEHLNNVVRIKQLLVAATAIYFFLMFIYQIAEWESYRPLYLRDYVWFAILSFLTNFGLLLSATPFGERWRYSTLCLMLPSILLLFCISLGHGLINVAGLGMVIFAAYRIFSNKGDNL